MSIRIMSASWDLQDISTSQKIVLLSLADQANEDGLCWPSASRTSVRTCLSERATRKAISDLEKLGHLSRNYQPGKCTYYCIHPRSQCSTGLDAPMHHVPEPLHTMQETPAPGINIIINKHKKPNTSCGADKNVEENKTKINYQAIIDAYHTALPTLPKVKILTEKRQRQMRACCQAHPKFSSTEFWDAYFESVNDRAWYLGENNTGWKADFDWLTNKNNFVKMYERGCQ